MLMNDMGGFYVQHSCKHAVALSSQAELYSTQDYTACCHKTKPPDEEGSRPLGIPQRASRGGLHVHG